VKIALHGYGRMGKAVEKIAEERGHQVVARFTRMNPPEASPLNGADVLIDFSHADAVKRIVEIACLAQINLVIGTTGWHDVIEAVRSRCTSGRINVVYAANFSPGANVLFALARQAASMLSRFDYDCGIEERHHRMKKDKPSGTAIRVARAIEEGSNGKWTPEAVSSRVGAEFGLHTAFFDSDDDLIEISHRARGREGFARGAVLAAEMLHGRHGFFSFEELLELNEIPR
jgi:4-hydroxy-tetrahydrodipicolinate reductase